MAVSRTARRKIKATLLHHTNLINDYLMKNMDGGRYSPNDILKIKKEINTILNILSQLNGNYDEETQENIKALIVTGKRISRHRERKSILSSQQTFEDWIAEISSLKLTITQSNGEEIKYSAERAIRVFLSYSHLDKILVGEIKEKLEFYGIEAFVAHDDIEPSEDWVEEILRNLKECDVFIPFISENFAESKWTDQESGIAFNRNKLIIPLDIGLVSYGFIGKYQAMAFENSSDACEEIIKTIKNKNSLMNKRIQDDLVKKFKESKHFTDSSFVVGILKKFEPFTEDQVNEIIRGFLNNNQLKFSFDARAFAEEISIRYMGIIEPELLNEFNEFIKNNPA